MPQKSYPNDLLSLPREHREKLRQPVPKNAPDYYQPALLRATDMALSVQWQKGNRQNGIPPGEEFGETPTLETPTPPTNRGVTSNVQPLESGGNSCPNS